MLKHTIVIALLGSAACFAQSAPLLTLKIKPLPGGGYEEIAINTYTAAATDYIVRNELYTNDPNCAPNAKFNGACISFEGTSANLPYWGRPGSPAVRSIPPGRTLVLGRYGSRVIRFGWMRNTGVIYADGAMAGMPAVLNEMMVERRFRLIDIRQDIKLLKQIESEPHPNWYKWERRFQRRVNLQQRMLLKQARERTQGKPPYVGVANIASRTILLNLQGAAAAPDSSPLPFHFFDSELPFLEQQLEDAKPPITVANNQ